MVKRPPPPKKQCIAFCSINPSLSLYALILLIFLNSSSKKLCFKRTLHLTYKTLRIFT